MDHILTIFVFVVCLATLLWTQRRAQQEKHDALNWLSQQLNWSHDRTLGALVDLQRTIYAAKDLDEVKLYLRNRAEEFVRSLQDRPPP